MKSRKSLVALVLAGLSALALCAVALPSAPPEASAEKAAAVTKMERKKESILKRLGMSAPMELPETGEEDFVAKAQELGWIIEVTLEEVEAALKAAAATPSNEDDIAAMRLAHRGSYRFYVDGIVPAGKTSTAR